METSTLRRMALLLAVVTATCMSESSAQTVYYPLAKGNVWDYGGPLWQWVLIRDTVLADGKTYGVRRDTWYHETHTERQQGDTVYRDGQLMFDFTRSVGDTLWQSGEMAYLLHDKGDTLLFGRHLRWWEFWKVSPYGGGTEIIVDSIGMVYFLEIYDFLVPPWILRGAIVDGIQYGTVDAVNRGVQPTFPSSVSLSQNYPNPFNPSTVIRYVLPDRTYVTLRVFNALGQQVALLVGGEQSAGVHEARFDASMLSSGPYFYRLQAGPKAYSRPMILLR